MTLRVRDLQSDSDMDSIRNFCDVFYFTVLQSDNDVPAMSMTVHVLPINQPRLDFQHILILRKLPFHTKNQNTKNKYQTKKKSYIATVFVLYMSQLLLLGKLGYG